MIKEKQKTNNLLKQRTDNDTKQKQNQTKQNTTKTKIKQTTTHI